MSLYSYDPITPGTARPPGYWSNRIVADIKRERFLRRLMQLTKQARDEGHENTNRFVER